MYYCQFICILGMDFDIIDYFWKLLFLGKKKCFNLSIKLSESFTASHF